MIKCIDIISKLQNIYLIGNVLLYLDKKSLTQYIEYLCDIIMKKQELLEKCDINMLETICGIKEYDVRQIMITLLNQNIKPTKNVLLLYLMYGNTIMIIMMTMMMIMMIIIIVYLKRI